MRVVLHLSDLHFGRVDETLIEPLHASVAALRPHLVVVSGDLTQRARHDQFRLARAFLQRLPAPRVVVPGNHDVPLYDVVRRFLRPLDRYRRYISEELEPFFADDEIAVAGLNTARSLTLQGGRVNRAQLDRLHRRLDAVAPGKVRIAVMHHPLDAPAEHHRRKLVGRAEMAMSALAACGVDLCLSGHLHVGHVGPVTRFNLPNHDLLLVQAGTATSTRARGEVNSFNVLHIDGDDLSIERHGWTPERGDFGVIGTDRFRRHAGKWGAVAEQPA